MIFLAKFAWQLMGGFLIEEPLFLIDFRQRNRLVHISWECKYLEFERAFLVLYGVVKVEFVEMFL